MADPRKEKVYKIGTLARESGFSPNLLRAWEQRYSFLLPERGAGGQRLYKEDDLVLVRYLAEKIGEGARIGELAAVGRDSLITSARLWDMGPTQPADGPDEVISCPAKYIESLVDSAQRVDAERLHRTLHLVQLECSPDRVIYDVLIPAMHQLGEACLAGKVDVAGEHLVSNLVEHSVRHAIDQARIASGANAKEAEICCCLPGEEHRLGLLGVAYSLVRLGRQILLLGSSMPLEVLEHTVDKVRPAGIWLSVTDREKYMRHRSVLAAFARRHQIRLVIGGQGIVPDDPLLVDAGCTLCPSSTMLPQDIYPIIDKGR